MNDCSCQSGLGYLLGQLKGLNDPVPIGGKFSIGFELRGFVFDILDFRSPAGIAEDIASRVVTSRLAQGLVRGYQLAGVVSPYIVIDGYSAKAWSAATDLRDALLTVAMQVYSDIDLSSVNFQVETIGPGTSKTVTTREEAPRVAQVAPSTGGTVETLTSQLSASLGIPQIESKQLLIGGAILFAVLLLRR